MHYAYPAIITKDEENFKIELIDFDNCYAYGNSESEAIRKASDVLGERLYHLELENKQMPSPTRYEEIKFYNKTYIAVDLSAYKRKVMGSSVRKSVTIPSWLNEMAISRGLNFSHILQEGIKQKLEISKD